ncbi:thiamine-phosphate kinase [Isoptericola sp. b441]|uniref:Thiamine-monophosphate kinase n=1 Tax=Actinotalea lenta TaxID=3064654 RepID=A0ABT9DCE3_9CELL|nr:MULTISPECIES: thiamine-phosphate kinase [unclassified Isoptericola]MDO8108171.1 thiamine-phosphate kinase [Isoptericola sp. b441]MDO8120158.1 thiamine-phosphate kinase [Isoptericola sp. b490]
MDEDGLLALIVPRLPRGRDTVLGPGDDAAIVAAPDGRVVVSTDVLVEGRHFRRRWSSGADVGYRAAMQNLADVAAMGARPTALVVALTCPADVAPEWLADLADGMAQACGEVGVVGGDLSTGTELSVAVTVLGDLAGRPPVLRSGAQVGDVVAHAGVRGRSAAGHALLDAGLDGFDELVAAYRRPVAPLGAGIAASRAGATAMLDVSDGLLRDALRIARASGVVLDLDPPTAAFADDLAVLAPAAEALAADAETWVLAGGEDHGLLATFPPHTELPAPFRAVGRVVAGEPGVRVAGAAPRGPLGWDHFAGRD